MDATEAVRRLRSGEVSPVELTEACLERIEQSDGDLNAVPIVCAERARARARRIWAKEIEPSRRGWLAGLPIIVKDLHDVEGVRTTFGSPIFKDNIAVRSSLIVERLERSGAVVLGKSNTPEFGAGANTFNELFGKTRNPWNMDLTCGGSSGGTAVALATGMAFIGTGSDLGGSLRTPAAFCGVVGLRPSPGRVPRGPSHSPFQTLDVDGPMARSVRDIALALDAVADADPRDPLSFDAPTTSYVDALAFDSRARRIGFSKDLGGITPVDAEIASICQKAVHSLDALIDDRIPDFSKAVETFTRLRAALYVIECGSLLEAARDQLKPEIVWNIEKGQSLSAGEIAEAERWRAELTARMASFFEDHDLLACPAAIVPPFDVGQRYLEELNGCRFATYVDWLTIAFAITITGCPAISIPCGFTQAGLPVGLQLISKPRGEAQLLAMASRIEQSLNACTLSPPGSIVSGAAFDDQALP